MHNVGMGGSDGLSRGLALGTFGLREVLDGTLIGRKRYWNLNNYLLLLTEGRR